MQQNTFVGAHGEWQLRRYPKDQVNLMAWDAADELLLNTISQALTERSSILLVNDNFGALAVDLSGYNTVSTGDSYVSRCGLFANWRANCFNLKQLSWYAITDLEQCVQTFDYVLIKIPKSLIYLEQCLTRIKPLLKANTVVYGAMMVKYLRQSMIDCFERYIGVSHTSLAKKKARLVISENDSRKAVQGLRHYQWQLEPWNLSIEAIPGCYGAQKLDNGTRFLLQYLTLDRPIKRILDLACGTGVIGLRAQQLCPDAELFFIDESYLAVASARLSYALNSASDGITQPQSRFMVADGLTDWQGPKLDLILCNPPFHQQNTVTLSIARDLFKGSAKNLAVGGQLFVVANRHLPYLPMLKSYFKSVRSVQQNAKFIIYHCLR